MMIRFAYISARSAPDEMARDSTSVPSSSGEPQRVTIQTLPRERKRRENPFS